MKLKIPSGELSTKISSGSNVRGRKVKNRKGGRREDRKEGRTEGMREGGRQGGRGGRKGRKKWSLKLAHTPKDLRTHGLR